MDILKILCIGDSNTYGYDPDSPFEFRYPEEVRWTGRLEGFEVINRGVNGITVPSEFSGYLDMIRTKAPDLVTVMLGSNDIMNGCTASDTASKLLFFLEHIKKDAGEILLIAPPPMKFGDWVESEDVIEESYKYSGLCSEVAKKIGCRFADAGEWNVGLTHDGVHFTADGHKNFAEGLESLLRPVDQEVDYE